MIAELLAIVPATGWAVHAAAIHHQLNRSRRDPLTGLLTRAGWTRRAERAIRHRSAVVVLLDLDRFKAVNDRFGHDAGDAVLTATGARLALWSQDHSGTAGRLGGDEFVAVAELNPYEVAAQVNQLRESLQQPVPWPGGPLQVGASIGIARPSELPVHTLTAALSEADRDMFTKKAGPARRRRGRRLLLSFFGGAR
jgi:diguanylate cyclase (GGDEF)-like protein